MQETNLNRSVNPRVKYKVCMTWHNIRNTTSFTWDQWWATHSLLKLHPWFESFWTCVLYAHTSEWRTISLASWCMSHAKLNLINICYVLMGYVHVGWEHSMLEILQIEKSMD